MFGEKDNGKMNLRNLRYARLLLSLIILATSGSVFAAKLKDSAGKAVLSHPDVMAKWHEFKASGFESEVSQGQALPKVDVLIGANRESRNPEATTGAQSYSTDVSKITLQQNLFDGFATHSNVKRLDHVSRALYYDLLDTSETVALEATKAYINLYRGKRQLEFAEENYVIHRSVFEKLKMRNKAGIATAVDFEMAGARLALSESELLTQSGLLHDAMARYQSSVGDLPLGDIDPPPAQFTKAMPKSRTEAVTGGFTTSPQLKAAVERILSAQRNISLNRAPLYPRVDFLAETSREKNPDGVIGNQSRSTIGFTVNFNLFNGTKDTHRISSAVEATSTAKDNRETVCRNLRQNLAVTYNENVRLSEQLPLLDQHQLSADKSREALRKQFDIGKRTLLDVLDTENEYYTARRDYFNGEMDLAIAQAKYLAGAGNLLSTLKLTSLEAVLPQAETDLDEDAAQHCPPDVIPEPPPPKKESSYVALLENPDGSTGKVFVQGNKGDQLIDKALFAAPMDGSAAAEKIDEEKIKQDFGEAMAARPPLPEAILLHFLSNSAKLTKESTELLPKLVESLASRPAVEVVITGYTDTVGSVKANQVLGLKRANMVANHLKAQGINLHSMQIESHGKLKLLVQTPDATPEARNRTVMIQVR